MEHKTETGKLILGNINHRRLHDIFYNHVFINQWDVINDLESIRLSQNTPLFDRAVYHSILGRSASLKYKYKKSHLAFGKADHLLRTLKSRSRSTKALRAFFSLNYGVSLGYTGKTAESKKYLTMAEKQHLELKAMEDFARLKLNEIDVGIYSSLIGYTSVKNELKSLKTHLKQINQEVKGYDLRMAVLDYLIYRKNGDIDCLKNSRYHFKKELANSKVFNYQAFWAQCGAIATTYYLGRKYRDVINNTPWGGISYANRFPPIILLIVQSEMINGNDKRAWDMLRKFGTHIDKMLGEFPEDEDYQKFILENFTEVVKERIIEALQKKDWTDEKKMNRVIRANEIIQNRLLKTTDTRELIISRLLRRLA